VTDHNRKLIIAGNWKMYKTRNEARDLAGSIVSNVQNEKILPEIVLIPPFTSLEAVGSAIKNSPLQLGAQNMDYRDCGAFTGEISPLMLIDLGVKYVLVGHSERRLYFGETNLTVNQKVTAALSHKLIPILCVGETLDEREADLTDQVVRRQIGAALSGIGPSQLKELVIAYEPVWAIGTGKVCEAQEANRVCALIRSTTSDLYSNFEAKKDLNASSAAGQIVPILYGGSVKPTNIEEQLAQKEIDGALVGGASLKAEEFLPIIKAAQKRVKAAYSPA
jgi:triosephosphate isomerase